MLLKPKDLGNIASPRFADKQCYVVMLNESDGIILAFDLSNTEDIYLDYTVVKLETATTNEVLRYNGHDKDSVIVAVATLIELGIPLEDVIQLPYMDCNAYVLA